MSEIEGTVLAGYGVDAIVGRGGMGVVYRATQLGLDRTVALKLIAAEPLEEETAKRLPAGIAAGGVDRPSTRDPDLRRR